VASTVGGCGCMGNDSGYFCFHHVRLGIGISLPCAALHCSGQLCESTAILAIDLPRVGSRQRFVNTQ
jgi:hypothetical protein